jgi:hypothetical protein
MISLRTVAMAHNYYEALRELEARERVADQVTRNETSNINLATACDDVTVRSHFIDLTCGGC